MTREAWLAAHPYLLSLAEFRSQVEKAAATLPQVLARTPNWNDYESDYLAGVPLLHSCVSPIDLKSVAILLESLTLTLDSASLPGTLGRDIGDLQAELRRHSDASQVVVDALLDRSASLHSGLLKYLGWTLMALYLSPVVTAFSNWRDEERWLRPYCPTCGLPPAMAQLVGIDDGRVRLLSCGGCTTRWRYRRTACPFCQNEDDTRLAVLVPAGEEGLRIDYCESCGGYIKTYSGSGSESVLLADWTSLHLDVVAQDRGLNRFAASLYEMQL
jgi:FdhE protein